jgi:hypothetical protein
MKQYFQDEHFWKASDTALMAITFVFFNSFSKNCFLKDNVQKFTDLLQGKVHRS